MMGFNQQAMEDHSVANLGSSNAILQEGDGNIQLSGDGNDNLPLLVVMLPPNVWCGQCCSRSEYVLHGGLCPVCGAAGVQAIVPTHDAELGAAIEDYQKRRNLAEQERVKALATAIRRGTRNVRFNKRLIEKYPQDSRCVVCLAEFAKDDKLSQVVGCGHFCHVGCLQPWLKRAPTCPICRCNVNDNPNVGNSGYSNNNSACPHRVVNNRRPRRGGPAGHHQGSDEHPAHQQGGADGLISEFAVLGN